MSLMKRQKKFVGWLVLFSFVMLLYSSAAPLRAEKTAADEMKTVASDEGMEPSVIEKQSAGPQPVKRGKFPWLWVAAGVVVAGVVVYFTLIYKPKYMLTVTVGDGVTGIPAAGTVEYKKKTAVTYSYAADSGYKKLVVTLDGVEVAASGTVTMDKAHTLAASATAGVDEQFSSSASSLWQPWHSSAWYVSGGYYKCNSTAVALGWEYNILNNRFQQNQYVAEVKLRRTSGLEGIANGIMLTTGATMTNASGYAFYIYGDATPQYAIYEYANANFQLLPAASTIANVTSSSAIHSGLNVWNILRVTRSGSNYTFSINGTNVYTFSDSTHDARYIALQGGCWGAGNGWDYDYVIVTMGTQLSVPRLPASPVSLRPADPYEVLGGEPRQN